MALLRTDAIQAAQEAQSQPPSSQPAPDSSPVNEQAMKGAKAVNGRKRPSTSNEGPKRHQNRKGSREDRIPRPGKSSEKLELVKTSDRRSSSSKALSDLDEKQKKTVTETEDGGKMVQITSEPGSESELSVLIDDEPRPKKRARKASSEKSKSKNKESSKPAKAPQQPNEPESEEIKRLQGWLVKCGIRKMWFKELAPYDTSQAKIRHLKDMLTEAGMTGRYSQEKATQIREERELKADLEAVKAGNKQWGRVESDDDGGGRPRRKVARGLQELDFLKDDDGDESD
ncbi:MAG: hypothetical protein LQ343_001432 [Gyalolechia ehrenbergii]|nr:MAG: hypothetical protein LQ343_001432 [Gyalolechia ehrenbergii]